MNFWSTFKRNWLNWLHNLLPSSSSLSNLNKFSAFQTISAQETLIMMFCGLLIGVGSGCLAVSLNWGVHTLQVYLQDHPHFLLTTLAPAIGAGVAVFVISKILKDHSGHGVPSVITAVTQGKGNLQRRTIFSRFFGSLLTVGGGGSAGLEGPILCIGAAWGSTVGGWLNANERRKKLLIGYGVAAAVAGIFNAPLTGLIFTLEIIVGEWTYLTILPTIVSAVTATQISRILSGNKIIFYQEIASFSPTSLLACVALGVVTGLFSIAFAHSLTFWQKQFLKISSSPWLRAAVGGFAVGVMTLFFSAIQGEGYQITQSFIIHHVAPELTFVLWFVVLKFIACGITLGSGGVGGVFAPSLVIGSGVGFAFGTILHQVGLENLAEASAFSLVGMAGMVTGVMHGPLTGIFLVMESTGGYSLILPLMLTASSAMIVNSFFESGSVYTRELIHQGVLIKRGSDQYLLNSLSLNIKAILDQDFVPIQDSLLLGDFISVFKESRRNYFPVLEEKSQRCLGVVFLDDIRSYLFDQDLYQLVTMGSIMRALPKIDLNEPISQALEKFEQSSAWSLPVVEEERFLGMLSKSTLFDHYRKELQIHSS